jgi:hypothetical protein
MRLVAVSDDIAAFALCDRNHDFLSPEPVAPPALHLKLILLPQITIPDNFSGDGLRGPFACLARDKPLQRPILRAQDRIFFDLICEQTP